MSARHKARKRALDVLYESEARGRDPLVTLGERRGRLQDAPPEDQDYAVALVEGVVAGRERIDGLLSEYAVGWELDRMPAVDRAILRIGTFEVLSRDDVPDEVALAEAVALAEELSTEESPQFVNGLLGRIVSLKPSLGAAAPRPQGAALSGGEDLPHEDPQATGLAIASPVD